MMFLLYYYDNRFVNIEFDYSNIKLFLVFVVMDHSPHRDDYDHDVTEDCSEFHDFLLGNKKLLKHIHSSEKYLPKESKTVILNTQKYKKVY